MIRIGIGVVALAVASTATAFGWSGRVPAPARAEAIGMLELTLDDDAASALTSLNYEVTGPGGFTQLGTVLASGSSLSASIGGLPVGLGLTLRLTAATRNDSLACVGAAPFDISANATTTLALRLHC